MSETVNNLRGAYHILERNIERTLNTQLGADAQLTAQVTGCNSCKQLNRCSARTVCRAALRHGPAEPGNPVYTAATRLDGSAARIYSSTAPAMSAISDAQLDSLLFLVRV
ncbi:hypothetical protein B0H16DRAFT_1733446 [Mycena metata]|uniref:Uncharacterized protein n=1 Tax=Mycena metata TaxID=1033252 RepID=A0AAD7MUB8_9AGAR|nr:hypothetical protein B0H16DRAFT_1733446 [Mycena metata]